MQGSTAIALGADKRSYLVKSLKICFLDASMKLAYLSPEPGLVRFVAQNLFYGDMSRLQSGRHNVRFGGTDPRGTPDAFLRNRNVNQRLVTLPSLFVGGRSKTLPAHLTFLLPCKIFPQVVEGDIGNISARAAEKPWFVSRLRSLREMRHNVNAKEVQTPILGARAKETDGISF